MTTVEILKEMAFTATETQRRALEDAISALSAKGDLISRQAVLDSLKEHRALYCDNTPETFSKLSYAEKSRVDELDTAIATIISLPSAENKGDLIRQAEDYENEIANLHNRLDIAEYDKERYKEEITTLEVKNKGEWIESKERSKHWYCSVCGGIHTDPETGKWRETFDYRYPFCPNCGARMKGGET